jgi:hypothetical protein
MQERVVKVMVLTLLLLALAVPGLAAGVKDGTGPIHSKTPFSYTGTIISCLAGDGIVLAAENLNVTIYGIGPTSYWESIGVARPAVGDAITVTGYTINYNGELRNIAYTIVIAGQTVTLRDADGLPVWRLR